jgi:hypothetical protein
VIEHPLLMKLMPKSFSPLPRRLGVYDRWWYAKTITTGRAIAWLMRRVEKWGWVKPGDRADHYVQKLSVDETVELMQLCRRARLTRLDIAQAAHLGLDARQLAEGRIAYHHPHL